MPEIISGLLSGKLNPIAVGVKDVMLNVLVDTTDRRSTPLGFPNDPASQPVCAGALLVDSDGGPYPLGIVSPRDTLSAQRSFMYYRNEVTIDWGLSGDVTIEMSATTGEARVLSRRKGLLGTTTFASTNDATLPERTGYTGAWRGGD